MLPDLHRKPNRLSPWGLVNVSGGPRDDNGEAPAIEDVIRQIEAVDPGFFSFRYPPNKKGEVSFPELRIST